MIAPHSRVHYTRWFPTTSWRRRAFLAASLALVAWGLTWERESPLTAEETGARDQGNENRTSDTRGPDPGLVNRVIDIQNRHTDTFCELKGVVGTGTGLNDKGNVVINVYTNGADRPALPASVDGVSVRAIENGLIFPLAGPPEQRRFQTRPVPIGVSANTGHGRCSTGTLGARLRGPDGEVYALSTNHAFADENHAPTQSPVLQPAPGDTDCVINVDQDSIGRLFNFKEIVFSSRARNRIDAAVISSSATLVDFGTRADGYGAPEAQTVKAHLGQKVQKYGRTTGLTHGTVTAVNVTALVNYHHGAARFVLSVSCCPSAWATPDSSEATSRTLSALMPGSPNWCEPMDPVTRRRGSLSINCPTSRFVGGR